MPLCCHRAPQSKGNGPCLPIYVAYAVFMAFVDNVRGFAKLPQCTRFAISQACIRPTRTMDAGVWSVALFRGCNRHGRAWLMLPATERATRFSAARPR